MHIQRNITDFDRAMRSLAAVAIGVLYFISEIYYWWGEVILTIGVYWHITALLAFSPFLFWRKRNLRHP